MQAVQPTATPLVAATAVPPTAAPPTIPAVQPTIESATSVPGVQLQPTIPPDILAQGKPKSHLPALFNIIDTVTDTRGASTLLIQYWEDVQATGSTTGCSALPPSMPDNNVFIPEIDFQASPDLREAVQLINSGLAALHTGWTNFQFDCNSHALADHVASGTLRPRTSSPPRSRRQRSSSMPCSNALVTATFSLLSNYVGAGLRPAPTRS